MRPAIALATLAVAVAAGQVPRAPALEELPFNPRVAQCYRAPEQPRIDGRLDDLAWGRVPWSEPFVDIQGDRRPAPRFRTRMKMLWDADHLYVAADMEEPDVWATLTARDSVIFHDNDFEVFIDPDGDTHAYYELEVNALATPWDLMLIKPYRDGGPAVNAWDIAGLQTAVHVRGTINRPGDRDDGWSVEIALPWKILREAAPGQRAPSAGERWRINFSRVEWQVEVRDGRYSRRTDPATNRLLPEDNWVWSPQGAIDMHMPERWGFVQFVDDSEPAAASFSGHAARLDPAEQVKWALRRLYYRQRDVRQATGRYASDLATLRASEIRVEGFDFRPALHVTESGYEISAPGPGGLTFHIRQDGRTTAGLPEK